MALTRSWHKEIIDYINRQINKPRKLALGGTSGSGGGTGYPPGGIIGQLPQRFICYDTTEGYSAGSTPNPSLVHNLGRIRGGYAMADDFLFERHVSWVTGCLPGTSGCISDVSIPFYSYSGLTADNVRDAIEEVYAYAVGGGPLGDLYMWHTFIFTKSGQLVAESGPLTICTSGSFTIQDVYTHVGTAPVGSSVIVDVNKNGTTIFTTQGNRPTITAGNTTGTSGAPDITSLILNDELTFDVDAVGSTTAGADLTVHIRCKQYILLEV